MKKVLIVDDVNSWLEFHTKFINNVLGEVELFKANSAKDAYNLIVEHNFKPFDMIITDLQMESDYEPLFAGEWLVEQIQRFKNYYKTKIIIISGHPSINFIAEKFNVDGLSKNTLMSFPQAYEELLEN